MFNVQVRLWQLLCAILVVSAANPTPTKRLSSAPPSQFVTARDGHFILNGSVFNFVGTNAYWLHALNTDEDIDNTLASIAAANFTVVRTWAFNDVNAIPVNGTWFQLIANGTVTINNGANGIPKLDTVVKLAKKHGIYLLLSLTNNWNPRSTDTVTPVATKTSSRNMLSNDYGGMDVYVRNLGDVHEHDQFYVNQTLLDAFKNYTTQIVSRYVNETQILAWELANDPRCNSTVPAATDCDPTRITRWHSNVAQHVKSIDPNHLISSGSQGFFCADCPKLFPRVVTPPPQPSPKPGRQRRSLPKSLTRARLLMERKVALKKERLRQKRSGEQPNGIKIRGRWIASRDTPPNLGVGSAYDGSFGVDSEDIINIPEIGFGSFQLFPDQYTYGRVDPTLPVYNQSLQIGLEWIRRHAEAGRLFNKPVSLNSFGLVTQGNAASFVPFNSSVAPFGQNQGTATQPYGVTDQERDDAYSRWVEAGVSGGLRGIVQYQWSQGNLTAQPGSPVAPLPNQSGETPNQNTSGVSPNDGYGIIGQGQPDVIGSIQTGAAGFGPDSGSA